MKIEPLELSGMYPAFHGMRNPMDSWNMSDTMWYTPAFQMYSNPNYNVKYTNTIGEKDTDLSERLQKAGSEHYKHLRMINVYADITAPRYWWNEFDTYRNGVEKVSCSTMHKLMSRELTIDDFEHDQVPNQLFNESIIKPINEQIRAYKQEKDPDMKSMIFISVIRLLPQSFLQKRTVMMSYAALRNIYRQREGHKLREWQIFREWVESLPQSWMITDILKGE